MPETTASRNELSRALRKLDLLEDYCDMFDRLVDMSDIGRFGDEGAAAAPGLPDADLAASRAYLYPARRAWPTSTRRSSAGFAPRAARFLAVNPYAAGAVRNRVAYAVGSGHTYSVASRRPAYKPEAQANGKSQA